jgi:hypothetical protein
LSVSIPGFKSSIWDLSYQQPQWTTSSWGADWSPHSHWGANSRLH